MEEKYILLLKDLRRTLHRAPELGHCEYETQRFIMSFLQNLGLSPVPCYATGVICFIDAGCEKTFALRADIDALPVDEKNICDYASQKPGVMHACGHDGHTAMLLCLAEYIVKENPKLLSNVLLVFQPAEESDGGAEGMIKEGILEKYKVSSVFGFHLSPDFPIGVIASSESEFFAGSAEIYFHIKGKAAHAADPEKGVNAAYAAALLTLRLSEIIDNDPVLKGEAVLSLCTINAGTKCNVLAENAEISGIMRVYDPLKFERLMEKIGAECSSVEKETCAKIVFEPVRTYIPLINDKALFERVSSLFVGGLKKASRTFLCDDFAFFAKARPSLYMLLGIRDDNHVSPLHSSTFDFDEASLGFGVETYLKILTTI